MRYPMSEKTIKRKTPAKLFEMTDNVVADPRFVMSPSLAYHIGIKKAYNEGLKDAADLCDTFRSASSPSAMANQIRALEVEA
jgi:hypothetical protein